MRYLLLFSVLVLISCGKNDEPVQPEPGPKVDGCSFSVQELVEAEEKEECTSQLTELIYLQEKTIGDKDTSFVVTYTIDNCGKVIQENYEHFTQENSSYKSEFKYNEEGKVIKELRDGILYRYVEWVDDKANVYDKLCNKISEYLFEDNRIVQHISSFPNANVVTFTLEYDEMGNLISIEDDVVTGVPYEFLEFDMDIESPFYLLNSVSILRFDLRPFMQYVHGTEKRNHYQILDVHYTLKFFKVNYELDSMGRVTKIDNAKHFHISRFNYN